MMNTMTVLNVLSFGAGTQSTALLLLAVEKKVHVDLIVFADTGSEPKAVYDHLGVCQKIADEAGIPFVITETKQSLMQNIELFAQGLPKKSAVIPLFTETGMLQRQCTLNYKIIPIQRAVRKFLSVKRVTKHSNIHVNMLLGITVDEITRAKDSREKWITNIFPLLDLNWNRQDAIAYCRFKGINPPRSACTFCPYKRNDEWIHLYDTDPGAFFEVCELDKAIRNHPRLKQKLYVCSARIPLEEHIKNLKAQINIFEYMEDIDHTQNECGGHCFL